MSDEDEPMYSGEDIDNILDEALLAQFAGPIAKLYKAFKAQGLECSEAATLAIVFLNKYNGEANGVD